MKRSARDVAAHKPNPVNGRRLARSLMRWRRSGRSFVNRKFVNRKFVNRRFVNRRFVNRRVAFGPFRGETTSTARRSAAPLALGCDPGRDIHIVQTCFGPGRTPLFLSA